MIKIQAINTSSFQEDMLNEDANEDAKEGRLDKKQVITKLSQFPTKLKIIFEKSKK